MPHLKVRTPLAAVGILSAAIWICPLAHSQTVPAAKVVDFNAQVRPLLTDRCYQCHGPDAQSREADLRLDASDPADSNGWSAVIDSNDPESSELWKRINSDDPDSVMPPPTAHKREFSAAERQTILRWIEQGANFESFWAFAPPQAPEIPPSDESGWSRGPIDRLVMASWNQSGLGPNPEADRRGLIRRLALDLTGLPPTLEQVKTFINDDRPDAYENAVEALLASPQYGEHMAKYWLDLVRFADTNGIHHDHFRELTPYRDWVIRSFNDNLPFDRFAVDQLAGDLADSPTTDQLIASGFNRLHLVIDRGTALPAESHMRNVVDRVSAVGTAFMGLTVGCAVCHDHKYDPVTQRDFFRLYAFFNNIDAEPETPGRNIHEPAIYLPTPAQKSQLESLEESIQTTQALIATAKQKLADRPAPEGTEAEALAPTPALEQLTKQLSALEKQHRDTKQQVTTSLIMREREQPRPAHIMLRGAYDQPGELVQRGTPAFLPPLQARGEIPDRLDLAYWLVDPAHPLMARVTVNRFWQQFFGVGLVRTSEDFGAQGEMPSHPELLDYLATRFVSSGWDVKQLVRSIVLSQTYRQSSRASESDYRADPLNRNLARGSRFRLDSETIRDQILFSCGVLNGQMFGKSVRPPQPAGLWKNVSMVSSSTYEFKADTGEDIFRRSLYTFWKRALPPPQMTIFDAPTRESCIARRERTNTPLQALVLMNEAQYFSAAIALAQAAFKEGELEDRQRLANLYTHLTSSPPDPEELDALHSSFTQLSAAYLSQPGQAQELLGEAATESPEMQAKIAATALVINGIFNLDIMKTRQ